MIRTIYPILSFTFFHSHKLYVYNLDPTYIFGSLPNSQNRTTQKHSSGFLLLFGATNWVKYYSFIIYIIVVVISDTISQILEVTSWQSEPDCVLSNKDHKVFSFCCWYFRAWSSIFPDHRRQKGYSKVQFLFQFVFNFYFYFRTFTFFINS